MAVLEIRPVGFTALTNLILFLPYLVPRFIAFFLIRPK